MKKDDFNGNQSFLIYQDDNGISNVTVRFEGEDVWLTAEQLQTLFQASQQDVSHHIQQIYGDGELVREATHKKYLLVRIEGNRSVKRNFPHYMTNFDGTYITEDDVKIAKNYLTDRELEYLRLLVSQFLDFAELQALEQRPMRMREWVDKLDGMLALSGRELLDGKGSISHEEACRKAVAEFREYRRREMIQYESDFDRAVRELSRRPDSDPPPSTTDHKGGNAK